MKEQLISFRTAKLAKEIGFNIPVLYCYNENEEIGDVDDYMLINFNQFPTTVGSNTNMYSAPTQALLQRWIREVYKINVEVTRFPNIEKWGVVVTDMTIKPKTLSLREAINMSLKVVVNEKFEQHEQALEVGLLKALELCKNNL